MNEVQELDPRVKGFEQKAKVVGVALVAVAAAAVVAVTGGAIIVASLATIGAIALVNVVPVVARRMALWKQSKLTQLAETFSEETLRIDEQEEAQRVRNAEEAFMTTKSELEGAIEELQAQRNGATEEEVATIDNQIATLQGVIKTQGDALAQDQADVVELKRVNRLLIAFDRSARAMNKAQGDERNPEEQQRLVTARNAIKTRMRKAVAGQQVAAMRREVGGKATPANVAELGHSEPVVVPANLRAKENVNVPRNR